MRISLTCDGNSVVPRNVGVEVTKYPYVLSSVLLSTSKPLCRTDIGPNQACTLFGAEAGLSEIRGRDYLVAGYGIYVTDLWVRCLLVLLGFALFFQITQVIALEYFPVSPFALTKTVLANTDGNSNSVEGVLSAYSPRRQKKRRSVMRSCRRIKRGNRKNVRCRLRVMQLEIILPMAKSFPHPGSFPLPSKYHGTVY